MRHFQGRRKRERKAWRMKPLDDHREAAELYTSKSVRPTDREIAAATSADERRVESTAKLNATYWLGLLSFDDGKYDVAAHWFGASGADDAGFTLVVRRALQSGPCARSARQVRRSDQAAGRRHRRRSSTATSSAARQLKARQRIGRSKASKLISGFDRG